MRVWSFLAKLDNFFEGEWDASDKAMWVQRVSAISYVDKCVDVEVAIWENGVG